MPRQYLSICLRARACLRGGGGGGQGGERTCMQHGCEREHATTSMRQQYMFMPPGSAVTLASVSVSELAPGSLVHWH